MSEFGTKLEVEFMAQCDQDHYGDQIYKVKVIRAVQKFIPDKYKNICLENVGDVKEMHETWFGCPITIK